MKYSNKVIFFSLGLLLGLLPEFKSQACSIIGYVGDKSCKPSIIKGLARLEYRGYDSAGIAYLDPFNHLTVLKAEGKLSKLQEKLEKDMNTGQIGIGHTRWATHGEANEINAHPHLDNSKNIAVVHNGIINNYSELRTFLQQQGHQFLSSTDTEVIPHLLQSYLAQNNDLVQATRSTVLTLQGEFAFLAIFADRPNTLIAARNGSPLVLGLGEGETFIASDASAFAGKTNRVIFVNDRNFAVITKEKIQLYDFDGQPVEQEVQTLNLASTDYEKNGHEHFMLKEIYEQRQVIQRAVSYYRSLGDKLWEQLGVSAQQIQNLKSMNLLGCGTSYNAASIGEHYFREIANLETYTHSASEYHHKKFFPSSDSLYLSISQSGETADVLESIRGIKQKTQAIQNGTDENFSLPLIALTNASNSTLVRESCGHLEIQAGPEIAVASTKAFTAQITGLYWLAHRMALERGLINESQMAQAENNLLEAADHLQRLMDIYSPEITQNDAKFYAKSDNFTHIGKHIMAPFSEEATLKLEEISYIFSKGIAAGELKHGRITLIEAGRPVVVFSHQDPKIYQGLLSNAQEVKARKGHIIAYAFQGQEQLIQLADRAFIIPKVAPLLEPLVMSGLMQFFAYQIARELGRDIDQPRYIAKACTTK